MLNQTNHQENWKFSGKIEFPVYFYHTLYTSSSFIFIILSSIKINYSQNAVKYVRGIQTLTHTHKAVLISLYEPRYYFKFFLFFLSCRVVFKKNVNERKNRKLFHSFSFRPFSSHTHTHAHKKTFLFLINLITHLANSLSL